MTALTDNRNTPELATRKSYSKTFAVLNGEILYAGGMLAMNTSTLEVQMASDAANLRVIGMCPEYVDNTADGEVSNARIGVFRYENSTGHALTKAYIGKICYVEDDNTVSHDPGSNAVRAGVVSDVDDDGVWVNTDPEAFDYIATAPTKPSSAAAMTQDTLTVSSMTGVANTSPAAETNLSTLTLTSMTGTANTTPAAETNIDTLTGTLTGTLDNGLADVSGSWDATAIATINKNFKEVQAELTTQKALNTVLVNDCKLFAEQLVIQKALNTVLINNCKSFATELNLVKTDIAAVRTGSESNNTAIDAVIDNLTTANLMA